jgi:hypothetical protein
MQISLLGEILDAQCAIAYWVNRARGLTCHGDDLGELESVDFQLGSEFDRLEELTALLAAGMSPRACRADYDAYPRWFCYMSGSEWTVDYWQPTGEPIVHAR